MACGKLTLLISAILLLVAVCFAAPAEKEILASESEPVRRSADEKGDLNTAASHWGGYGYGGYGHWGGGYPYWGSSYYGWPSYGYGYGHGYGGWPYYGYGHHSYWL